MWVYCDFRHSLKVRVLDSVTCIVGSTVAISICIWSVNIVMGWWILAKSNNLQSIIMNTYTIQYNTRAIYTRKDKTRTVPFYTSMSYLIRRVLAKPRLILDEMYRLYGKFAPYLRRVLCNTRLIFPHINGPNVQFWGNFKTINQSKISMERVDSWYS